MKRIIGILAILMTLLACGCTSEPQNEENGAAYIWGTHNVYVDMNIELGSKCGFNLPFAYKGKRENIELVGVKGKNTEALKLEVRDDTLEVFEKTELEGYKLGYLGVVFSLERDEKVIIEQLDIRINGTLQEIIFDNPVIIQSCSNADYICEKLSADVLLAGINNMLMYTISSSEVIEIIDCGLTGAFEMSEVTTFIDGKEQQLAGKKINENSDIRFELISVVDEKYEYGCLGGNFYIRYLNKENVEKIYYFNLIQQGAGEEMTAMEVLSRVIHGND